MADAEDDATITWCTYTFPRASTYDGTLLKIPDAYPADQLTLPHQHDHLERRFPRAVACPAAGDQDPEGEGQLEKIGWRVGVGSEPKEAARSENRENIKEEALVEDEKNETRDESTGTYLGVAKSSLGFV